MTTQIVSKAIDSIKAGRTAPERTGASQLEISVVFTTYNGTLAALQKASELSCDLGVGIRLVVPQVVPYAYAIDHPPVDSGFLEAKMSDLALQGVSGEPSVQIDLCFCRQRLDALLHALKPNSVVVIAYRERWWPTEESRIVRALRSHGHHVLALNAK